MTVENYVTDGKEKGQINSKNKFRIVRVSNN